MAGHSKWANIKHKKAASDAKKMKIFQKISKEISVAIKEGGSDPTQNSKLKLAIEKAKANNIPNDNINKLLNKGADKNEAQLNEITYEGYGPNGVAVIVETLTDNVNRTASYVKSAFNKNNGNLGTSGSVSYMFKTEGVIALDKSNIKDDMEERILELNITDMIDEEEVLIIKTEPKSIFDISEELKKMGIEEFLEFEITKTADIQIEADEDLENKIQRLIDYLEESEDVSQVYTNLK